MFELAPFIPMIVLMLAAFAVAMGVFLYAESERTR